MSTKVLTKLWSGYMLFTESNLFDRIEPVELFLRETVCVDKLALYQPIIDLLKTNEMITVLNAINSIINVVGDESSAERIDEINTVFTKYLVQLIQDFEIVCDGDLPFLYKLYKSLSLLDSITDHRMVVNICEDTTLTVIDKLFLAVNLVERFDELEFMDNVKLVSLSFIKRLNDTHFKEMEVEDDIGIVAGLSNEMIIQVKALKFIVEKYPTLSVLELIRTGAVRVGMATMDNIVDLMNGSFDSIQRTDNVDTLKYVIREFIAMALIETSDTDKLKLLIKENIPKLIEDDDVVFRLQSLVDGELMEVAALWIK